MKHIVVIGATGEVGRGIVAALLARGHHVVGVARDESRLANMPCHAAFQGCRGTLECDASAEAMVKAVQAVTPHIDSVVTSVNGPRHTPGLIALTSPEFAALVAMDLITHFTAAKAFLPAVAAGGTYLGIGGGTADFILQGGTHMSVAQAGLRMFYRGLNFEQSKGLVHVRQLIIASVVNSRSMRGSADPLWVTDAEVGTQAADIIAAPEAFPDPIYRITRRDTRGVPGFLSEGPTRIQALGP